MKLLEWKVVHIKLLKFTEIAIKSNKSFVRLQTRLREVLVHEKLTFLSGVKTTTFSQFIFMVLGV